MKNNNVLWQKRRRRVFEITDAGRDCMKNWVDTLENYRRGIDQIVVHLREVL